MSWDITIVSVSPALPLKFHHIFWFPGFSDRRIIICTWSVFASATYRLWVAVGLTSCCLFHGVTASVALRNRKRNWLLCRLRVEGGRLPAVSPEQWKTAFFHGGSFPCKLSVPYANKCSFRKCHHQNSSWLLSAEVAKLWVEFWCCEVVSSDELLPTGRITSRSPQSMCSSGTRCPIWFDCSLNYHLSSFLIKTQTGTNNNV